MPVIRTRTVASRAAAVLGVASALTLAALTAPHVRADATTQPGYNGRITFESRRPADGKTQVFTMNSDGTDLRQVTTSTTHDSYSPQFLPYSDYMVFVDNEGDPSIELSDANGNIQYTVNAYLPDNSTCSQPSQPTSYPGLYVVFTCGQRKNAGVTYQEHHIWRAQVTPLDQPATRLTTSASTQDYEDAASVSPDGSKVVFQSYHHDDATDTNSNFKLETVNTDGSHRTVLTSAPSGGGVYDPEWSPDGRTIVFEQATSAANNATTELYVMPTTGGTKTRLTHDAVAELHPTWSPDSHKILFSMVSGSCSCVTLATMRPTPTDAPHPIGNVGSWNSGHWDNFSPHWQSVEDNDPPTKPVVTGAPPFTLGNVTLHLSSTDAGAGVGWYVERSQYARWNSTTWSPWSDTTTVRSSAWTSPTLTAGATTCFRITAVDRRWNVGPPADTCTARPAQETTATYAGGWARVASSAYYGGAANRSSKKGARLSLAGFHGDRVGLLVRTCATCGTIKVYVAGVLYGTLDTHSSTTHYRVWRTLPRFTATSGTVKFVATSSKPVYVDAIGLSKK